jgi:60 kDa SS-A/Ro ribonucleoprotein
MKLNVKQPGLETHEGGPAKRITPELELRRSIMACMLWENQFYESGEDISKRIASLIPKVKPYAVADMAVEAREKMKLRHAPLFIVREMARLESHKPLVASTLERVIQRADELTEFLAIYWKDGREKLSKQVKKGLAKAFPKFDGFKLAKYNRDGAVKLRDVMFLVHPKPKDKAQAKIWKKLVDGTLPPPDTWEVALSAGKDKKATWERLIKEGELGALALLRNLRNMQEVGVDEEVVFKGLAEMQVDRVLPYRFVAAARYAPQWEPQIEQAMMKCLEGQEKLTGKTALLIDVSGSMDSEISGRSEMKRLDAACGLAVLLREICESVEVLTFSQSVVRIPARRGFALRDAVVNSQPHGGTYMGQAVQAVNKEVKFDRIIVITDEQTADSVPNPKGQGYVINVASDKNGVGYGAWTHIDGWSEHVINYIRELESE